jgi:hypothetical protein
MSAPTAELTEEIEHDVTVAVDSRRVAVPFEQAPRSARVSVPVASQGTEQRALPVPSIDHPHASATSSAPRISPALPCAMSNSTAVSISVDDSVSVSVALAVAVAVTPSPSPSLLPSPSPSWSLLPLLSPSLASFAECGKPSP